MLMLHPMHHRGARGLICFVNMGQHLLLLLDVTKQICFGFYSEQVQLPSCAPSRQKQFS